MRSLLPRAAILVATAASTACGSQSTDPALGPPPVTVETRSLAAPEPAPSPETKRSGAPAACDPASAFVEVKDGDVTRRFGSGRKINERGAHHPYAEVIVRDGKPSVLLIEGAGGEKPGQGLLTIGVDDPGTGPGEKFESTIEFTRPGWTGRLSEGRIFRDETVTITRYGAVGEIVEGSFGPVELEEETGDITALAGRFQVCRIADWHDRDL
jgi:hypothetical protein